MSWPTSTTRALFGTVPTVLGKFPTVLFGTLGRTFAWTGACLGSFGALVLLSGSGFAQTPAPAGAAGAPQPPGSPVPRAAPAPAGSAAPAPAGSAGAAPPAGSAAPGPTPPPYMYQEPWTPPAEDQRTPPGAEGRTPQPYSPAPVPAPYVYEPPPPAPPLSRSPWTSLWVGARVGALFPFGNAYSTGGDYYYEFGESWDGLASSGPLVEGDLGVRVGRNYIIYGFWEHAWMSTGSDATWRTGSPDNPGYGDQTSATTDYTGVGFRWSSRPDSVGLVLDVGLGYRWFRERWATGRKMDLSGFGEFRFGFGADIRATRAFSVTPMLMFSTGTFRDRDFYSPAAGWYDIPSYGGSHGTVTLSVGGHFDLLSGY